MERDSKSGRHCTGFRGCWQREFASLLQNSCRCGSFSLQLEFCVKADSPNVVAGSVWPRALGALRSARQQVSLSAFLVTFGSHQVIPQRRIEEGPVISFMQVGSLGGVPRTPLQTDPKGWVKKAIVSLAAKMQSTSTDANHGSWAMIGRCIPWKCRDTKHGHQDCQQNDCR